MFLAILGWLFGLLFPEPPPEALGPCDDGWGEIAEPAFDAVHVRSDGDDDVGDGSVEAPFRTLVRAHVEARNRLDPALRRIAVGPGAFLGDLRLDRAEDDGLVVEGCGVEETTVEAEIPGVPLFDLAPGLAGGLRGMTIRADRPIIVGDGALVSLVDLDISGHTGAAIEVEGWTTYAEVQNVQIGAGAEEGCGWGLSVVNAAVSLVNVSIVGSQGIALYAESAEIFAEGLEIEDVAPDASGMGHGIHAIDSAVYLRDISIADTTGAGIFLDHSAGSIQGIVIDFTAAGLVGEEEAGGDGIVVHGDVWDGVAVIDATIKHSDRSAVLVDGGEVYLRDLSTADTGLWSEYHATAFSQHGGVVVGPEARDSVSLADDEALELIGFDPVCED